MALINEGIENDLLKAAEKDIESRLRPETRNYYQRIVLAGMKYAIHGGANGVLRGLNTAKDPVKACAIGGVDLAFMLLKSENPHPSPMMLVAASQAGYTLMLQAMDVAAKMKLIEITEGDGGTIDQATRTATDRIMMIMHVTPEKFHAAASKVHGLTKDPAQMQALKLKLGVDRDPRAPMPTLPNEEATDGA